MSKRKDYIDIAKGIGIILVVLGHLNGQGQMSRNFMYSFHMPLFFALSGMFVNTEMSFGAYLKKQAKSVYLPYAVFVLFDVLVVAVVNIFKGKAIFSEVGGQLFSLTGIKMHLMNIPLWFLFALFIIHILFYCFNKVKSVKVIAIILSAAFVFASGYWELPHYCLWLIAVPCFFFYGMGNLLKDRIFALEERVLAHKKTYLFLAICLGVGVFFASNCTVSVDTTIYRYGNPFLYFINGALGILMTLILSVLLTNRGKISDILRYYGQNSIVLLVSHYYICRPLVRTVMAKAGLWDYVYSPGMQILMLAVMLLLSTVFIFAANRYLFFVFGKKN